MGKDQELLQAVKTEDLLTVQKLLQRPRPGKASESLPTASVVETVVPFRIRVLTKSTVA